MDDTFIILFALCLGIYTLVKGDCNNTHPDQSGRLNCCTNFYIYNGECRECPAGFFGENCSRQCGYPFYGTLCQNKCQCDNITCDRVMGCIKITSTDAAKEILPMKIPSPESNYSTSQEETRNGDTSIKTDCNNTYQDESGKYLLSCCTNYYIYNRECRECPPGFFGERCAQQCYYPYYGRLCQYTCQCDTITCDRVMGCTNNKSMDTFTDSLPNEISTTQLTNKTVTTNKVITTMVDIHRVKKQHSTTQLKKTVLSVGSFLVSMIVICAIIWVSMSLCKKRTVKIVNEDNDVASVYMEIDVGSNHIDSRVQILNRTVLDESCTTLNETTEDRPELPARMAFVLSSGDDAFTSCSNTDEILRTDNENVSVV